MGLKTNLLALTLSLASFSTMAAKPVYHAHLNYLQAGINHVSTDSDLDVTGGSVEFQAQMTPSWIARGGYLRGEDSDVDVDFDQIYGSVGYILSNSGNTAHIIEAGLSRNEVDVAVNNGNIKLDAEFYGIGYRYWWHITRRVEAELDINAWKAINANDGVDDDFQMSGQLRLNYYFADNWGAGIQYKYNEDADTVGLYLRYIF